MARTLSPEQVSAYYKSQSGAARPLLPLEWLAQQGSPAPVSTPTPSPGPTTGGTSGTISDEEINNMLRQELTAVLGRVKSAQTRRDYFTGQRSQYDQPISREFEGTGITPTPETVSGAFAGRKSRIETPIELSEKTVAERLQTLNALRETAKSLSPDSQKKTNEIINYEYSQLNPGFKEFTDIAERKETPDIANYEYAKNQGYEGTFEQWQKEEANRKGLGTGKEERIVGYEVEQASRIKQYVQEALPYVTDEATGLNAQFTRKIASTPAFTLERKLDAIRNAIGPAELQRMRAASPTGGALGQVAVQELAMLQNSLGSLDTRQNKDELVKVLRSISLHYDNLLRTIEQAGGTPGGYSTPKDSPKETRAINGIIYEKVPGGWKRVK